MTLTRRICCSSSLAAAATPVRLSDFRPAESARETLPPLPAAPPYPPAFPPGAVTARTAGGEGNALPGAASGQRRHLGRGVADAGERARELQIINVINFALVNTV